MARGGHALNAPLAKLRQAHDTLRKRRPSSEVSVTRSTQLSRQLSFQGPGRQQGITLTPHPHSHLSHSPLTLTLICHTNPSLSPVTLTLIPHLPSPFTLTLTLTFTLTWCTPCSCCIPTYRVTAKSQKADNEKEPVRNIFSKVVRIRVSVLPFNSSHIMQCSDI